VNALREIAWALGGEVSGAQVLAPGPGHSRKDRGLSIRPSASAPGGFIVNSFSGDDWRECRRHVEERLGVEPFRRPNSRQTLSATPLGAPHRKATAAHNRRPLWLWRQRKPIEGSIAERYLREARGYAGLIPTTLWYLPPRDSHPPSLIAAFGMASEPEPGVLTIADANVRGVHLTRLATDGRGKAGTNNRGYRRRTVDT
jgi:hypothetical protein